ncbi:MAG: hypothetical protein ACJAUQ_000083 [Maribacter sp.]
MKLLLFCSYVETFKIEPEGSMNNLPNQYMDGASLKPTILGKLQNDRPIFLHNPHYSRGLGGTPSGTIRMGDYKLIEFYEDMHI